MGRGENQKGDGKGERRGEEGHIYFKRVEMRMMRLWGERMRRRRSEVDM